MAGLCSCNKFFIYNLGHGFYQRFIYVKKKKENNLNHAPLCTVLCGELKGFTNRNQHQD